MSGISLNCFLTESPTEPGTHQPSLASQETWGISCVCLPRARITGSAVSEYRLADFRVQARKCGKFLDSIMHQPCNKAFLLSVILNETHSITGGHRKREPVQAPVTSSGGPAVTTPAGIFLTLLPTCCASYSHKSSLNFPTCSPCGPTACMWLTTGGHSLQRAETTKWAQLPQPHSF